jgi:hypothetical protein
MAGKKGAQADRLGAQDDDHRLGAGCERRLDRAEEEGPAAQGEQLLG